MKKKLEFRELTKKVQKFANDREWEPFHSPKNLAMALSVECAELMEHFQWLTEAQSRRLGAAKLHEVATELADVQIYLIRLAHVLGVDLIEASSAKLVENARKYPVDKSKGKATKYTRL